MERLLSKDPSERFNSASEVSQLLEQCLSHLQQPSSVPLPQSLAKFESGCSHRPPLARIVGATGFAFALVLAGIFLVLELNKGRLTITSEADDIPIKIMQGDKVAQQLTVTHAGKSVRVATGTYQIEIDGQFDGLYVKGGTVSLQRGGIETIRIVKTGGEENANVDSIQAGTFIYDAPGIWSLHSGVSLEIVAKNAGEEFGKVYRAIFRWPADHEFPDLRYEVDIASQKHTRWAVAGKMDSPVVWLIVEGEFQSGSSIRTIDYSTPANIITSTEYGDDRFDLRLPKPDEVTQSRRTSYSIGALGKRIPKDLDALLVKRFGYGKKMEYGSSSLLPTGPYRAGGQHADVAFTEGSWLFSGRICDVAGRPLPGVVVAARDDYHPTIDLASATTDSDGRYKLEISSDLLTLSSFRDLRIRPRLDSFKLQGNANSGMFELQLTDAEDTAKFSRRVNNELRRSSPPYIVPDKVNAPKPVSGKKVELGRLAEADFVMIHQDAVIDRRNARSIVEAYVAAALANDVAKAAALAKNSPADPKRIAEIPKLLNVHHLSIKTVYVNDPANPTTALAISEALKLTKKQPDGHRDGHLVLTLTMSEESWIVTDIDFESEEDTEDELKRFRDANPKAVALPPLTANVLTGTDSDSRITPQAVGKRLGTVLGKPIHEGDINKNTSTRDNLIRLVLGPLTEDYCRKNGLGRVDEIDANIKDDEHRKIVGMFVFNWELNRHLYEKHGGRVEVTPFGSVAFDGMRKWLDEREQAGDFEITDPQLKTALKELYNQVPPGTMFAKPDQLETAFETASIDRFIEEAAKYPAGAYRNPADKLVGMVLSQPIHLHERYLANKAELPGLLYNLFVPKLEERYRKKHPEIEPTDAEIDDLTAKTKAGFIQSALEQRKSLELALSRKTAADPSSKADPRTLAAMKEVDDMLKRLEANDGRSHAAEMLQKFKFQKHIYENFGGGRALMGGSQGLVLLDATKRWLEERQRLGELQITSDEIRKLLDSYWTIESHPGSKLMEEADARKMIVDNHRDQESSPQSQSNRENDSAMTVKSSPQTMTVVEVVVNESSREFPFEKVAGHIASIKQRTAVVETAVELRRITGLDFGNGIDGDSRQSWLDWWDHETSCIENAKDGVRQFVLVGQINDQDGKPISGANVRAHVPLNSSPSGHYQLGTTLSDANGQYVLLLGIPSFDKPEESKWIVTFTARNPPRFVNDETPVVKTMHRNKSEADDAATKASAVEKNDDAIFAGRPRGINFQLKKAVDGLPPPSSARDRK